jgi:hypothetical protein
LSLALDEVENPATISFFSLKLLQWIRSPGNGRATGDPEAAFFQGCDLHRHQIKISATEARLSSVAAVTSSA